MLRLVFVSSLLVSHKLKSWRVATVIFPSLVCSASCSSKEGDTVYRSNQVSKKINSSGLLLLYNNHTKSLFLLIQMLDNMAPLLHKRSFLWSSTHLKAKCMKIMNKLETGYSAWKDSLKDARRALSAAHSAYLSSRSEDDFPQIKPKRQDLSWKRWWIIEPLRLICCGWSRDSAENLWHNEIH